MTSIATHYEADPFTDPNDPTMPAPSYLDVTARVIGSWSINNGRNYELGTAEASVWTPTLRNEDAYFDIANVDVNLAAGVAPTFSAAITGGLSTYVTDGNNDGTQVCKVGVANTATSCTLDLGVVRWLGSIVTWHDFLTGGLGYAGPGNKVEVSVDGVTWVSVYDQAYAGNVGNATAAGFEFRFPPIKARYVRQTLFAASYAATWCEIQVYAPSWRLFRRFRAYKVQGPNQNLVRSDVATAFAGDVADYPVGTVLPTGNYAPVVSDIGAVSIGADVPIAGSRCYSVPVLTTATVGKRILSTQPTLPVTPTTTATDYVGSVYVRTPAGAATCTVALLLTLYGPNGYVSTSVATFQAGGTVTSNTAWTRLSHKITTPAWVACRASISVLVSAAPASNSTVEVGGFQWEQASAVTGWVAPGTRSPVFTGQAERMPRSFDLDGTMPIVTPPVVDYISVASNVDLDGVIDAEFLLDGPVVYYPLTDPAGATTCVNLAASNVGPGIPFGSKGAHLAFQTPVFGDQGLASLTDALSGVSLPYDSAPRYALGKGTGIAVADGGTVKMTGGFTLAVWAALSTTVDNTLFAQYPASWTPALDAAQVAPMANTIQWTTSSGPPSTSMTAFAGLSGVGGPQITYAWTNDGKPHLFVLRLDQSGRTLSLFIDGVLVASNSVGSSAPDPTVPQQLTLGDTRYNAHDTAGNPCQGSYRCMVVYNYDVPDSRIADWYTAGKTGFVGEQSGARYARLLKYGGIWAPSKIDAGLSTMGALTGLAGTTLGQALEDVVTTEAGMHYTDGDGFLTFKDRFSRYKQTGAKWTFGEHTANGEVPFLGDLNLDYDPTTVINQVEVDLVDPSAAAVFAEDATSARRYYPRSPGGKIQVNLSAAAGQQTDYAADLIGRNKDPRVRAQRIRLTPGQTAGTWPTALGLYLNDRVRAWKRVIGLPDEFLDGFIEKMVWTEDADGPTSMLDLVIAPGERYQVMLMGALRTAVGSATAGQTSLNLFAFKDAGRNPAAANIPVPSTWMLNPGQANAEIVTISSLGTPCYGAPAPLNSNYPVGASIITVLGGAGSPPWNGFINIGDPADPNSEGATVTGNSGGVLTLSAPTTKPHNTGDPVFWIFPPVNLAAPLVNNHAAFEMFCELLPTGVTDPTTWDAYSVLDSTARLAF